MGLRELCRDKEFQLCLFAVSITVLSVVTVLFFILFLFVAIPAAEEISIFTAKTICEVVRVLIFGGPPGYLFVMVCCLLGWLVFYFQWDRIMEVVDSTRKYPVIKPPNTAAADTSAASVDRQLDDLRRRVSTLEKQTVASAAARSFGAQA